MWIFLQTTNVGIKRSVEHLYHEWNMPSLPVSYPVSWKSFREMEKIDRIAQHGDYPTLLSYSPRKQAAACARANARLYRLPICYSIKQITGMQFKVVPSQSRLHEFRAISHGCMYTCAYVRARVCVWVCTLCIYTYTCVSNFSFPEESAYPPRKETWLLCNRDSSSPWFRLRWDAENKRTNGIEMEGRYIQSDCPLLSRHSCERIGNRLQITLVICCSCSDKTYELLYFEKRLFENEIRKTRKKSKLW